MKNVIGNIQALRFFAALSVVGYHVNNQYLHAGGGDLFFPFWHGEAGVDVFFVISGFIMWHTTETKAGVRDAAWFIYKRLARIFLGLWPLLAIAIAAYWLLAPGVLDSKDIVKSVLLIPQGPRTNVIPISWTLSYEILFYMSFSLLILAPRKYSLHLLFGWAALVIAMTPLVANKSFIFSPLIFEFIAGSLLAVYMKGKKNTLIVPVFLLSCALFWLGAHSWVPGVQSTRVLTYGVGAVALVYCAVAMTTTAPAWIIRLGDASYSLYLSHAVVLIIFVWTIRDHMPVPPQVTYPLLLLFMIGLSVIWYKMIEKPLYDLATGRLRLRTLGRKAGDQKTGAKSQSNQESKLPPIPH